MSYDPEWTLDQAWEAHQRSGKEGPDSPLFQWVTHQELIALGQAFEAGDKWSLMLAIRKCANHDMPLPEWARSAYIAAFDTVLNARSKSWDEVFGMPYPKGQHLAAIRKKRTLRYAVCNEIKTIRKMEPGTAIDEGLFERVGSKFNIGKTLAADLYYSTSAKS